MKKEINLREVLYSKIPESIQNEGWSFGDIDENWILDAMKEACKQTLELAAENAKLLIYKENMYISSDNESSIEKEYSHGEYDDNGPDYHVDVQVNKQSISNTINQIK